MITRRQKLHGSGHIVTMFAKWSGWRESNPYSRLGKPVLCH